MSVVRPQSRLKCKKLKKITNRLLIGRNGKIMNYHFEDDWPALLEILAN